MRCTKINFLQLTLLFALALISCKKESLDNFQENNPSSPTDFPLSEINIQTTKVLPSVSISNHQLVLDMEEAIRELTFKSLIQTVFYPQIYGLTGSSATPRTGCPMNTLATVGNVHTITLDYGTGCTTDGGADYEGIITLVINGNINTNGTVVNVQLDDDFKINSTNDMDGSMTFTYVVDGTEEMYRIDDITLQNTNTNTNTTNSNVTQVSLVTPALNGQFTLKPNTIGDLGNATDILNDTIAYSGCFLVHCPNAQTLRSCTISEIDYSIPCGIPFDGNLILDTLNANGTYGAGIPVFGTFGNMDFAYPNATSFGECDNEIQYTDNVTNTTSIIIL